MNLNKNINQDREKSYQMKSNIFVDFTTNSTDNDTVVFSSQGKTDSYSYTEILLISICVIIISYVILYHLMKKISNSFIFLPYHPSGEEFEKFKTNSQMIRESVKTSDGFILDACLYNSYHKPSYEDETIYLYSHGNSGWLGQVVETTNIKNLSKSGSVFIYDYRGYGKSTGTSSDESVFIDSLSVFNFLIFVV